MVPKSWDNLEGCRGCRTPYCIPSLAVVSPPPSFPLLVDLLCPSYPSQEQVFSPPFFSLEEVPFLLICLS